MAVTSPAVVACDGALYVTGGAILEDGDGIELVQKYDTKTWKCNAPAGVRELLGLGPPYYFGIVPKSESGATKYDVEWAQLEDPMGFKAKWGPTTAGNDDLKIVL